ncbi:MAG TPA: hypothetical protein VK996_10450 [Ramlibacter sp.]|nr:hypothetical protein [Ramlibacter sp.]
MNPLLAEGLTDAIGFVGGALLAYWLARIFGVDPLAAGYGGSVITGIIIVGIGGGVGVQIARRIRAAQVKDKKDKKEE